MNDGDKFRSWLDGYGLDFHKTIDQAEKLLMEAARIACDRKDGDAVMATMELTIGMLATPTFRSPVVLSVLLAHRAVTDALLQRSEGK